MYKLVIKRSVVKDLRHIPKAQVELLDSRIQALAEEPRPRDAKKLQGSINKYRLRQGDYRVVYKIEDEIITVTVIAIGHRKDIYDRT